MKKTTPTLRLACLLTFFLAFSLHLSAQWKQLPRPENDNVYDLAYAKGVWIGLGENLVYRSVNDGITWERSQGLNLFQSRIGTDGTYFYLVTRKHGLWVSHDLGQSWSQVSQAISSYAAYDVVATDSAVFYTSYDTLFRYQKYPPYNLSVAFAKPVTTSGDLLLRQHGNDLYIATTDSLLRSTDNGVTWNFVYTATHLTGFDLHDSTILVMADSFLRKSVDYGTTWQTLNTTIAGKKLRRSDDTWFIIEDSTNLVRFSSDEGLNWNVYDMNGFQVYQAATILKQGTTILISDYQPPLRSGDNGLSWSFQSGGLLVEEPIFHDVFFGAGNYMIYDQHFSSDNGETWYAPLKAITTSPMELYSKHAVEFNGAFYCLNDQRNLYRSDGDFNQWTFVSGPLGSFPISPSERLLPTSGHFYRTQRIPDSLIIHESVDGGLTWQKVSATTNFNPIIAHNGFLFQFLDHQGVFRSGNGGVTWEKVGTGLPQDIYYDYGYLNQKLLLSAGNALFWFIYVNAYVSTNNGLTFNMITGNPYPYQFVNGAYSMASDGTAVVRSLGNIWYSADLTGNNWVNINGDLPLEYGDYEVAIHNGYIYCNGSVSQSLYRLAIADINFAQVSGTIYHDDNNNGVQDAGETPYPGVFIKTETSPLGISQPDGKYAFVAAFNSDTIRPVLPKPWMSANPPFYPNTGPGSAKNFGLYSPPGITDLGVVLTNLTGFVSGFNTQIRMTCRNWGTVAADGILRFVPPQPIQVAGAVPAPDLVNGDTLLWYVQNLDMAASQQILIEVYTPPGTPFSTFLEILATVSTTQPDANPADNIYHLYNYVQNAFDPNDKQCAQGDLITPDQIAARMPLEFTVRFQNTGNYPAQTVRILDTIKPELDLSTFQLLDASHPCKVSIQGNGITEFKFENINLPPVSTDEPGSHGFVKYTVAPKASLGIGNQITNTAYIYFGGNQPVATNTTTTQVDFPLAVAGPDAQNHELKIYPVPTSSSIWLDTGISTPGQLDIINATGQVVLHQNTSKILEQIDLTTLPSGYYLAKWTPAGQIIRKTGKILKLNH